VTAPAQTARVLRYAALSGFSDLRATYTFRTWLFGLFARMVAQVAFFASIGRLLGSDEQVRYLLIGNAVMVAASASLTVAVATQWERGAGTLPLIVACPSSPLVVLMGRSVVFVANGLVTSLGGLFIVAPLFDVALPWGRFPAYFALLLLVTLSSYMAAAFLGALLLGATGGQRTVANVARLVLMTFAGVSVPRDVFPQLVQWLAELLPLTSGLAAIRELLGADPDGAAILSLTGRETVIGLLWLALALVAFKGRADAGRRDGTIVFSNI